MFLSVRWCFLHTIPVKDGTFSPKNILPLANQRSLFFGIMVRDFEVFLILGRFQIRQWVINLYNTRYGIPEITPSKLLSQGVGESFLPRIVGALLKEYFFLRIRIELKNILSQIINSHVRLIIEKDNRVTAHFFRDAILSLKIALRERM